MLMYFLSAISNKNPAARPLRASNTLGHCPIFTTPLTWYRVTALSSVLKIQVISATKNISTMPVFNISFLSALSSLLRFSLSVFGSILLFFVFISMKANIIIKAERMQASEISVRIRLLLAICNTVPSIYEMPTRRAK